MFNSEVLSSSFHIDTQNFCIIFNFSLMLNTKIIVSVYVNQNNISIILIHVVHSLNFFIETLSAFCKISQF